MRESLAAQWLGLGAVTAGDPGSISDQRTEILEAAQHSQKEKQSPRVKTAYCYHLTGSGARGHSRSCWCLGCERRVEEGRCQDRRDNVGTKQLARCARVVSAERLAHVELLSVLCEPGGRAICCGQVSEDWNRCPGAGEVESCRGQLTPGTMASWAPNILVWDVLCRGRGDRCWSRFLRKSGRMSRTEGQRGKAVEGPGASTAVTMPCAVWRPGAGSREALVHVGKPGARGSG